MDVWHPKTIGSYIKKRLQNANNATKDVYKILNEMICNMEPVQKTEQNRACVLMPSPGVTLAALTQSIALYQE